VETVTHCEPHDSQFARSRARQDRRKLIPGNEVGRQKIRTHEQYGDRGPLNSALYFRTPFVAGGNTRIRPDFDGLLPHQRREVNLQPSQPLLVVMTVADEYSLWFAIHPSHPKSWPKIAGVRGDAFARWRAQRRRANDPRRR